MTIFLMNWLWILPSLFLCQKIFKNCKKNSICFVVFSLVEHAKQRTKLKISTSDGYGNITNYSPKNSTLVWRKGFRIQLYICKSVCTLACLISAKTGNGVLGWFPFGELTGQLVKDWHLGGMLNVGQSNP